MIYTTQRRQFVYDTWDNGSRLDGVMVECTLSITHCLRLNLQLHTIDLVRTCRISSFCTVAWQLARFQLTRRIARSLGDSWASCFCWDMGWMLAQHDDRSMAKQTRRICQTIVTLWFPWNMRFILFVVNFYYLREQAYTTSDRLHLAFFYKLTSVLLTVYIIEWVRRCTSDQLS